MTIRDTKRGIGNQQPELGSYMATTRQLRSANDVVFKVDRTYSMFTKTVSLSEKKSGMRMRY